MSITPNVLRHPWSRAPVAVLGALALLGASQLATTDVATADVPRSATEPNRTTGARSQE